MLEVKDLSCERGHRILFSKMSFKITPGELLLIEGYNGSGKTSLLRLLCSLALPMEGHIYWKGNTIEKNRADYLSQMMYIGHAAAIKHDLTAIENLHILTQLAQLKCPQIQMQKALHQMGLYGFEDVLCRNLSAGQKRRVVLSLLLLSKKPLWILDEPLTAIDKKGTMLPSGKHNVQYVLFDSVEKMTKLASDLHSDRFKKYRELFPGRSVIQTYVKDVFI